MGIFVVPDLFFANRNGALFDSNFLMIKYVDETGMGIDLFGASFGRCFFVCMWSC